MEWYITEYVVVDLTGEEAQELEEAGEEQGRVAGIHAHGPVEQDRPQMLQHVLGLVADPATDVTGGG